MTEPRHDMGDDVSDTVRAAGLPPDATFAADLRARLAAVVSGDIELEPIRPERSRPWIPLVAAAAVVALVVGAIALIARERDADVVPASDLRTALVGSTWVALDAQTGGDLPMLELKIGETRPDVVIIRGTDGCNEHSGEFRLDGTTVVDAAIMMTYVGCPSWAVMPRDGATLSIAGDVLTVSDDGGSTAFTAIESLPVVAGSQLDGEWTYTNGSLTIADGQVTSPANVDGTAIDLTRRAGRRHGGGVAIRRLAGVPHPDHRVPPPRPRHRPGRNDAARPARRPHVGRRRRAVDHHVADPRVRQPEPGTRGVGAVDRRRLQLGWRHVPARRRHDRRQRDHGRTTWLRPRDRPPHRRHHARRHRRRADGDRRADDDVRRARLARSRIAVARRHVAHGRRDGRDRRRSGDVGRRDARPGRRGEPDRRPRRRGQRARSRRGGTATGGSCGAPITTCSSRRPTHPWPARARSSPPARSTPPRTP